MKNKTKTKNYLRNFKTIKTSRFRLQQITCAPKEKEITLFGGKMLVAEKIDAVVQRNMKEKFNGKQYNSRVSVCYAYMYSNLSIHSFIEHLLGVFFLPCFSDVVDVIDRDFFFSCAILLLIYWICVSR